MGEGGLRPVESGNVKFVDWFAAGRGEAAEEAAVEGRFEGKNRHVRGAWRLIVHG